MPSSDNDLAQPIESFLPDHLDKSQVADPTLIRQLMIEHGLLLPEISNMIDIVPISERRIALMVRSQTIANRLRFELNAIRSLIRDQMLPKLQQVKIIVSAERPNVTTAHERPEREVSSNAQASIFAAADHIDDAALSSALRKLGRHVRKI